MSVMAVVGAQWGDEGKGKIIDELADRADYVVRYQGGGNAGPSGRAWRAGVRVPSGARGHPASAASPASSATASWWTRVGC